MMLVPDYWRTRHDTAEDRHVKLLQLWQSQISERTQQYWRFTPCAGSCLPHK